MSPDARDGRPPDAEPPPAPGQDPDPAPGPAPARGPQTFPAPGAGPGPVPPTPRPPGSVPPTPPEPGPGLVRPALPPPGPEPGPVPPRLRAPDPDPGLVPPTLPPPDPLSGRVLPDLEAIERWARDVGGWAGTASEDARYDVETITVDGMHHVVRSTSRSPGGSAGVPPDAARPPNAAQCAAVRSVVRALLDLAGHQSGPSRIGVAFTDGRPRVVAWDVAPQPGGGPPPGEDTDRRCGPAFPRTGNAPGTVRERPPEP